nr:hypothetical protein CPGR_05737 [Mycolicibacter nonchromogenicus]
MGRGKTCALIAAPDSLAFSTMAMASRHSGTPALAINRLNVTGSPTSLAASKTCCSTVWYVPSGRSGTNWINPPPPSAKPRLIARISA